MNIFPVLWKLKYVGNQRMVTSSQQLAYRCSELLTILKSWGLGNHCLSLQLEQADACILRIEAICTEPLLCTERLKETGLPAHTDCLWVMGKESSLSFPEGFRAWKKTMGRRDEGRTWDWELSSKWRELVLPSWGRGQEGEARQGKGEGLGVSAGVMNS